MDIDAIYAKLSTILQNVFDDDALVATPAMTADDVDGWDSFAHLRVIAATEKAFGVNFSASQITGLKNVGELAALVQTKAG
jgi:acyl carrier protein